MKIVKNTKESNYKLIDFEEGFKYESINDILIKWPDSNAFGKLKDENIKNDLFAQYNEEAGKGHFDIIKEIPEDWIYEYKDIKLKLKLGTFKHIGVFPEQSYHWDYISKQVANKENINVLNLFAYTGSASINAAQNGASEVVHVDALKQLNNWAKENSELSNTSDKNIRYMNDDVITFLKREIKRGNKYQVIIMDPPSFGRGPKNQIWKFDKNIDELLSLCSELLEDPLCVIISTYTNNFKKNELKHLLAKYFQGNIDTYDLFLESESERLLPCGSAGVVKFKE